VHRPLGEQRQDGGPDVASPCSGPGLIAAIQAADGSRALLSDWDGLSLTEQTPEAVKVTPVEQADVPELLAARFGLPGYAMGDGGRLHRAAIK
jgi:hypothetical protein